MPVKKSEPSIATWSCLTDIQ